MLSKFPRIMTVFLTVILAFQLSGCGTLLYPERRGQVGGHLDAGIVILDGIGLLFFLIPGIIAFAVDFSNGTIYVPGHPRPVIIEHVSQLREIKFDPKHTSLAQLEQIIKDKTSYTVHLNASNVRISRLKSGNDMMQHFAQAQTGTELAFND